MLVADLYKKAIGAYKDQPYVPPPSIVEEEGEQKGPHRGETKFHDMWQNEIMAGGGGKDHPALIFANIPRITQEEANLSTIDISQLIRLSDFPPIMATAISELHAKAIRLGNKLLMDEVISTVLTQASVDGKNSEKILRALNPFQPRNPEEMQRGQPGT